MEFVTFAARIVSSTPMKKYILADNQCITREGLASLLKKLDLPYTVDVVNGTKELQDILKIHPEAAVIVDYTLFDFAAIHQLLNIKQGVKKAIWILFSEELGDQLIRQALFSDDMISIVMKHDACEDILTALHNAYYNEVFLCDYVIEVLKKGVPSASSTIPNLLTATEKIILHEIALGKMTKQIASERNLSFHTINSHRKNIFRKLEVNNVHEAIKYALRAGIIDQTEYYI